MGDKGQKRPAEALANPSAEPLLLRRRLRTLVSQVEPRQRLEPEVEDLLLEIADDFVESVVTFACALAKHRSSDVLEVKDVQLHLERNWNLHVPGFGSTETGRAMRPVALPDRHRSRLLMVQRAAGAARREGR